VFPSWIVIDRLVKFAITPTFAVQSRFTEKTKITQK